MGVVGMEGPECYSGTDLLLVELLRRSDACPAGALLNDTTGFAEISHFSSSSPSSPSFSFNVTPQTSPPTTRDRKQMRGIPPFSVQINTVSGGSSARKPRRCCIP